MLSPGGIRDKSHSKDAGVSAAAALLVHEFVQEEAGGYAGAVYRCGAAIRASCLLLFN